jgi:hypothetical protein
VPPSIAKGTVIAYRIFDLAEEIDLAAVQGSSRLELARSGGHSLVVRNAPVTLALGPSRIRIGEKPVDVEIFARLWDYGVVSIQFHVPIAAGTSWHDLVRFAAAAEDDNEFDAVARAKAGEVLGALGKAFKGPHEPHGFEDYIVYFLEKIDGIRSISELSEAADIPALILGEPTTTLSARQRSAILESTFQYSSSDLAVIDWNSALLVEPSGSRDVADMLEFASTHLTEFRYFDELLDERLDKLYESIERRRVGSILRRDFESISREAGSLYIEFSKFVERVENSLKFVGDFYLATVFRAAVTRFNMHEWEENVTRKMNALARVSELLKNEVDVRRSHWLEVIVIVLILFEIVSAVWKIA